jgi:Zn-dependent M32 family carboxypeptidase
MRPFGRPAHRNPIGWYTPNAHTRCHTQSGDDLMKAVTGAPLDPSIFLDYLRNKYTPIYKL